jgi:hypothetical protein
LVLAQRFRKLRRRLKTVRRECLGYDRHSRRYWLAGVEDVSAVGAMTAKVCLLIEPYSPEECVTGIGLDRAVEGAGGDWQVVDTEEGLNKLVGGLSDVGRRERALKQVGT